MFSQLSSVFPHFFVCLFFYDLLRSGTYTYSLEQMQYECDVDVMVENEDFEQSYENMTWLGLIDHTNSLVDGTMLSSRGRQQRSIKKL